MAGTTMVRRLELQVHADDGDTALKLDKIQERAERLKELHPDLAVRIDTAAASEKLKVLRQELRDVAVAAKEEGDAVEEAGAKTAKMGDEAEEAGGKSEALGKAWEVTKYALLGVGAALGYGVIKAAGFQAEMERVHTQAGVSVPVMNTLSAGVLKLAGQVGQGPDSLAEAMYHVASNMASMKATAPQMLNAVKVAAEGASVGGADLVDVTNALGAAIASGIKGVNNYQSAMGALNATVGAGDMTMQDLSEAMGTGFLSNVKIYGSTLNDVGAILATFGDNNIRGAHAGTQLRMSVQSLAVQASSAGPYLKELGLQVGELGKYQSIHGTVATINLLVEKLKSSGIAANEWGNIITQLFGKKAGAGIAVLIDQYERLDSKQEVLAEGAKGFGAAWAATQQTAQQKLKDLEAGSEALAISLGEKLLPAAVKVLGWLTSFVNGLENGSAGATTAAAVIGTVLAGIALKKLEDGLKGAVEGAEGLWKGFAKVTQVIGAVVGKLFMQTAATEAQTVATEEGTVAQTELNTAMSLNPVGLIIIAIAALGVAFYELWTHVKGFRDFWKDAWHDIAHAFDVTRHSLAASFGWVTRTARDMWRDVSGFFRKLLFDAVLHVLELQQNLAVLWGRIWADTVGKVIHWGGMVLNWFAALPGRIGGFLAGLYGDMLTIGKNMVIGIWNGLASMGSWLWNQISSWAGNILGDIGKAFGIGSPSKYTRVHGQMLAEGLALGIQDGQGRAAAAAQQMARRVLAATYGTGTGYAGGHGGGTARIIVEFRDVPQAWRSALKKSIRISGGNAQVIGL